MSKPVQQELPGDSILAQFISGGCVFDSPIQRENFLRYVESLPSDRTGNDLLALARQWLLTQKVKAA